MPADLPWHLLADAAGPAGSVDVLPGAPTWAGMGLVTGLLWWLLFKHLPNKDRQIVGLIADRDRAMAEKDARHDAHTAEITARFNATMFDVVARFTDLDKERRADFRDQLQSIASGCSREVNQLGEQVKALMEEVRREMRRNRSEPPK